MALSFWEAIAEINQPNYFSYSIKHENNCRMFLQKQLLVLLNCTCTVYIHVPHTHDDFMGHKSWVIFLNSLNIRTGIWGISLTMGYIKFTSFLIKKITTKKCTINKGLYIKITFANRNVIYSTNIHHNTLALHRDRLILNLF